MSGSPSEENGVNGPRIPFEIVPHGDLNPHTHEPSEFIFFFSPPFSSPSLPLSFPLGPRAQLGLKPHILEVAWTEPPEGPHSSRLSGWLAVRDTAPTPTPTPHPRVLGRLNELRGPTLG